MNPGTGKRMAELSVRFKSGKPPYLTDQECLELRDWLNEIHEYNFGCGHGINAVYFGMQYEDMVRVCDARGL